ncbi:Asp-tRNA(Asn)/Glu-tRNA(Gln) amidotransferase subunit GatA [Candidatus Uhrbacteria bacterium]|jgi:aspartyl-tRNA(Asn)/glutamyl-tRNA(Gln) amidotransferase subunit A|nr:Asp-tRNA(Asn)/Glu-tRNA(Gln) amidotransferase subunit GatA [Candidatus Uhrbacteria bacterium]
MAYKTAIEIRDAVASGEATAVEVVTETLARIKDRDEKIGAFLETFDEEALEAAKRIDEMKAAGESLPRLAGVPVAVKDNMLVKGHIASACSGILAEHVAAYDATVVTRLREAGAVIIGRTNMDDAAMGSSTETSYWQKTKNPWDVTRVPGGSSGGPAAAVASGMVPLSLGSDTGGSVRQPASLCGVVGMKPTYGKVSRYGLIAMASSLDQIGPFATTVEDATLLLEVIEGADPMDATSVDADVMTHEGLVGASFEGLRVGVPKEYFIDGMDPAVEKAVREAIDLMKENGAEIVDISIPLTEYALPAYYIIQPAEASSNVARYDGIRYGKRAEGLPLLDSYRKARGEGFGTEVKRRIMLGTYILSAGYYDAFYKKSLAVRSALMDEMKSTFKDVDVIVGPTSPSVAWPLGEKFDDPIAMYLADIFTCPANITGNPGISVPCGMSDGLPIGLQFIGGHFKDAKILQAAAAYQSLTDWHTKEPGTK